MKALKSLRLHIGLFGRTNVGKSSFLNKITNQAISIVSDTAGTTTDVVEKSMELLPIGPVTFLDTAGLDDTSQLGALRIEKTQKILNRCDIAVLITDKNELTSIENNIIEKFKNLNIPYLIIINKQDNNAWKTTRSFWRARIVPRGAAAGQSLHLRLLRGLEALDVPRAGELFVFIL